MLACFVNNHNHNLSTHNTAGIIAMATLPGGVPPLQPGQQPTPEQIQAMQRQLSIDAQKHGLTVPQFIEKLKQAQIQQAQQRQRAQAQGQAQGQPQPQAQLNQPQPIQPGPPNPAAIAVAKFLKSQDLKPRTCILNGQRKDMFKGMQTFSSIP